MPLVSESFKCPLQSLINDPIHSPHLSFVSAIKKCLPRAVLHFLLLFCVFFTRKKIGWRQYAMTWVSKSAKNTAFRKKQIFSKSLSPNVLVRFPLPLFFNACSGEEKIPGNI